MIGAPIARLDARAKVTGTATYAFEHESVGAAYAHPILATIARGRVTSMDGRRAAASEGVIAVLTVYDAPRLAETDDPELTILQDDAVRFRGQIIGAVVAESAEIARHAADLVTVAYHEEAHDTEFRADGVELHTPEDVAGFPPDSESGDVDAALRSAPVVVDATYRTPVEYPSPMEPHACIALWSNDSRPTVTLYDSTQGVHTVRQTLAPMFGLASDDMRVIAPHVGGGFGSKGAPHAHNVLAVLAAQRCAGRPVKLALSRQQMFTLVGYRTPTIQRIRLGASRDGSLVALWHQSVQQTGEVGDFVEHTAVPSRTMYASPNRRTSHRVARLDVPAQFWMRAPGECPGMFAGESAIDELAYACGVDPIELRIRNEPDRDPESGDPWSGRHLVECLRTGAAKFGWAQRNPEPGRELAGDWFVGTGVASATYPANTMPGNTARIEFGADSTYAVQIGAADIGTGTWTALAQIAAEALGCPVDRVKLEIGDTDLPAATVAGGSSGISSWGTAITLAARAFRNEHGDAPAPGASAIGELDDDPAAEGYAAHSFGAQFVEVRVHRDTCEIRVPRMLGVFSIGRAINPRTLRSQLIGGMTMGLSMALHEEGVRDSRFGHVVTQDFASYHISTHADVGDIEAIWLDEVDEHVNPMGAKGAGEIGIVGAAAAVANAVCHATGVRVRHVPITADDLL